MIDLASSCVASPPPVESCDVQSLGIESVKLESTVPRLGLKLPAASNAEQPPTSPRFRARLGAARVLVDDPSSPLASPRGGDAAASPPARHPATAFHVNAAATNNEEVVGLSTLAPSSQPGGRIQPSPQSTKRVMGSRARSSLARAMFTPADGELLTETANCIMREVSLQMQYEEEVAHVLFREATIRERKERTKLEKKLAKERPAPLPSLAATLKAEEDALNTHSNSGLTTPRAESRKSSTSSAVSTPRGSTSSVSVDREAIADPAIPSTGVLGGDMLSLQTSSTGPRPQHRSTAGPHSDPTLANASSPAANNSSMNSKSSRFLSFFNREKKPTAEATVVMSPPHDVIPASETGSFASTARDSFFGSPLANNSALFGSTLNTSNAATQSPSASSRFLGLALSAPKPPSASSPAIHAAAPESLLRAKVILVGASGSGKTTFKMCFTNSVMKSLPDVKPSLTSSSSRYYHTPASGSYRKKLSVTVVDGGPSPLESGLSNLLDGDSLYVLTLSLEGVKQRSGPKKLFSRSGPVETIIHRGDQGIIRHTLRSIAAVAKKNVAFVLLGTKADLLTDPSSTAILSVIAALSTVVMSELASLTSCAIMYRGCFVASAVDHKVHSEMREAGPQHIQSLWAMLCETLIKDASVNAGGTKLISPSSFGWPRESISAAVNTVSEVVEKHSHHSTSTPADLDPLEREAHTAPVATSAIEAAETRPLSFNPKLGNLGTSVIAKFIAELPLGAAANPRGLGSVTIGSLAAALISGTTNLTDFAHAHAKAIQNPPTVLVSAGVFSVLDLKRSYLFKDVSEYTTVEDRDSEGTLTDRRPAYTPTSPVDGGASVASVKFGDVITTPTLAPGERAHKRFLDRNFSVRVMSSSLVTGTEESGCPTPSDSRSRLDKQKDCYAPTRILSTEEERLQLELLKATNRGVEFVTRARTNLNFICVPKRALEHHMYSVGVASRSHFNLILKTLVRNDEISVFEHQPEGREDTILFQPHLVSRATVAMLRTMQLSCYPLPQRRGLLPSVDPEAVDLADPRQLLASRGLLNDKLLFALSNCIVSVKRDPSERADLYLYLLVTSDTVAICRGEDTEFASERRTPSLIIEVDPEKTNATSTDEATAVTKTRSRSFFGSKQQEDPGAVNSEYYGVGWRFVVPSLVQAALPQALLQGLGSLVWLAGQNVTPVSNTSIESAQSTRNNRAGGAEAAEIHLRIHPCPTFLPHQIIARLAHFIASPNCVRSNGVWLSDPDRGARCLIVFTPYDNNEAIAAAAAEQARVAESASKGPRQVRSASRTHLKPHTGIEAHGMSVDVYAVCHGGGRLGVTTFLSQVLSHVRQSLASRAPGVLLRTVKGRPPILNAASSVDREIISHWEDVCVSGGQQGVATGEGAMRAFSELDRLASTV